MKRKHIAKFKRLSQFLPLFNWYKCDKCEHEFRRERGWKAVAVNQTIGIFYVPQGVLRYSSYYLCASCAPTREKANKYFLDNNHLHYLQDSRPKPSPVPPKSVARYEGEQPQK